MTSLANRVMGLILLAVVMSFAVPLVQRELTQLGETMSVVSDVLAGRLNNR
jgi:hypothetical protein